MRLTEEQRGQIRDAIELIEAILAGSGTSEPTPTEPDEVILGPEYYRYAKSLVGLREEPGPGSNPEVLAMIQRWLPSAGDDSEVSWCGAFVAHVMERFGYPVAHPALVARAWMGIYPPVPVTEALRGDVVVLWRESRNSWKGHVAFLDRWDDGGKVRLLGGNQGNAVNYQRYDRSRILGIYRPAK